jgi:hypothetical protein
LKIVVGTGLDFSFSILLLNLYLHHFSRFIPAEIPTLNQEIPLFDTVISRFLEADSTSDLHEKSGYLSEQRVTAP